jgi:hypothetical protein
VKVETRNKNQLVEIEKWLNRARPMIEANYVHGEYDSDNLFYLLIAVEQILKFLKENYGVTEE